MKTFFAAALIAAFASAKTCSCVKTGGVAPGLTQYGAGFESGVGMHTGYPETMSRGEKMAFIAKNLRESGIGGGQTVGTSTCSGIGGGRLVGALQGAGVGGGRLAGALTGAGVGGGRIISGGVGAVGSGMTTAEATTIPRGATLFLDCDDKTDEEQLAVCNANLACESNKLRECNVANVALANKTLDTLQGFEGWFAGVSGQISDLDTKFMIAFKQISDAQRFAQEQRDQIKFELAAVISDIDRIDEADLNDFLTSILFELRDREDKINNGVGMAFGASQDELNKIKAMLVALAAQEKNNFDASQATAFASTQAILEDVADKATNQLVALGQVQKQSQAQTQAILNAIDNTGNGLLSAITDAKQEAKVNAGFIIRELEENSREVAAGLAFSLKKQDALAGAIREFVEAANTAQLGLVRGYLEQGDQRYMSILNAVENQPGTTIVCADNDASVLPGNIKTSCDYAQRGPVGAFVKGVRTGVGAARLAGGVQGAGVGGGRLAGAIANQGVGEGRLVGAITGAGVGGCPFAAKFTEGPVGTQTQIVGGGCPFAAKFAQGPGGAKISGVGSATCACKLN